MQFSHILPFSKNTELHRPRPKIVVVVPSWQDPEEAKA
jgi:hypothetical protein